MTNFILLGNIISLLASSPATSFSLVTSHVEANEIVLMNVHSIDTWDKYYSYLQESEANPDKANRKVIPAIA